MKKSFQLIQFILALILFMIFISCESKSKNLDNSHFGYEYYPLEVGKYWLYQVDSTIVDDQGSNIIKSKNFIREEITDMFLNAESNFVYRIERSASDSIDGFYRIKDVWTAEKTENSAFFIEENLRFNKLVFPVDLDRSWRGNLFDNLVEVDVAGEKIWVYKDWGDYKIESKGLNRIVNGHLYEDIVSVKQADHDFAIERRFSIEHYAPEVGLIEREMVIYDTQCECPGQAWVEKASSGFTLRQILLESN